MTKSKKAKGSDGYAGASIKEVQEILGHKRLTMPARYAHPGQEHKKKAVNLLKGLTATTQNRPAGYINSDMSQNVTFCPLNKNHP
jgi:hypothetical protein